MLYRHQEFQFLLLHAVHCGTESEHQVLNDSHIFVSFTEILLLFGTKFQYSCKRRQDEEGKQSDKAVIRDLVLTFRPTMRSVQRRKLKLLMLVLLFVVQRCYRMTQISVAKCLLPHHLRREIRRIKVTKCPPHSPSQRSKNSDPKPNLKKRNQHRC